MPRGCDHPGSAGLPAGVRIFFEIAVQRRTIPGIEAEADAAFADLAGELHASLDRILANYWTRSEDEAPEWTLERPDLEETARSITRRSFDDELRAFREGGSLPDRCPDGDVAFARGAAQLGAPPSVLTDAYRRGHAVQWAAWFELVEEAELAADARRDLLRRGSDFFFAYADRLGRFTLDEYTEERDRMMRDREQRRAHLVRQLLEGVEVSTDALEYDVAVSHLGLVAWGEAGSGAARAAAEALGRRLLLVSVLDETYWGWLGGPSFTDRERRALARLTAPPGAQLAFGDVAAGPEGFRATHRQALQAQRAGRRRQAAVTHYDEVALESLAAADEREARGFVTRELAGLEGDDVRSSRLRATLRAYFASGQNAAATAARIGVHEQTVGSRLRAVEERTGRPVAGRRAELETALRLREYLG